MILLEIRQKVCISLGTPLPIKDLCQVDLKWTIRKKWMEMTKKKPRGHNIGGTTKQKRRKERKKTQR